MHLQKACSPLMRVTRVPSGRYHVQVGLVTLDLGPGELNKLNRLLNAAVEGYAQSLAKDACGVMDFDRRSSHGPTHDPSGPPLDPDARGPLEDDQDDPGEPPQTPPGHPPPQ